mgnify:CR=1 FL=1
MKQTNKLIKEEIKSLFNYYKNKGVTLKYIADKFNVSPDLVGKIFREEYGNKYRKISRYKSYEHIQKINYNDVLRAFKQYKRGTNINEISSKLRINEFSLRRRFHKIFGDEYEKISRIYLINNDNICKKVSHKKIEEAFEEYKINNEKVARGPYINVLYLNLTGVNNQNNISKMVESERKTILELGGNVANYEKRDIGVLSGYILETFEEAQVGSIYSFVGVNEKDETVFFEMIIPKNTEDKQGYVDEFYSIIESYHSL